AALVHGRKKLLRVAFKAIRRSPAGLQHTREHLVREKANILSEHAEHEPVDEMGNDVCLVATVTQTLGQLGELLSRFLGEHLPCFGRSQGFWIEEAVA